MANSFASQCITPEMVAQITGGDGHALLSGPAGGECQLQQQVLGNQIVASGTCNIGNGGIQESARLTFDTAQHFSAQVSFSGTSGMQHLDMSVSIEGRRIGGC